MDTSDLQVDVVHILGHLDRFENFYFTQIYCYDIVVPDFNPRVLLGTSAINVGIDNERVDFVMRISWPRDLFTFFQEKGRGSPEMGSPTKCVILADIRSFVDTLWSIFQGVKHDRANNEFDPVNPFRGFNLAIKSHDALPAPRKQENDKYKLCSSMRRKLELRYFQEFCQVLHFHCLDNGCMQRRAEGSCPQVKMKYLHTTMIPIKHHVQYAHVNCISFFFQCMLPVLQTSLTA